MRRGKNGRRCKRSLCISILLVVLSTFVTSGLLAEDRVAEGAKDIGTGISAVPKRVAETTNESNILYGITVGMAEGLLNTAKGIGEGVFKILTFYQQND